ncbi:MAG: polyprenol monophosphomannose synthase [Melioribacteraceae bacterium]|nr:polyprenol monophosphomannose synthase [Melioribacteraceae bacterium]MCO6473443.1 polyprenol monophosphomannose synthase [Melioribacteraceae bacterium]MDD3557064.1 polyprenol monophosphomannose synthase [Melioribacteraceae bacterium]
MKKTIVIIPTYNERKNIELLISDLIKLYPEIHVLVVDDNSPDGTGDYVKSLSENDDRIHVIQREKKMGLGTAYVAGFKYMLAHGYDLAVQMDADYSHDPKEIKKFLKLTEEFDLIIGSRYVQGVNVINWPISRLLLSYFANLYTKIITGLPVKDSTGGFKCFRREVLESIDLDKINSNGYSFQIEMNFKSWKNGFKLKETPIIFTDRVEGSSKMSRKIVYEAVFMVWKLRFEAIAKNKKI